MFTPKCGRRQRGRWCPVSRMRTRTGRYAPACGRHLTAGERAALGLLPGAAVQEAFEELVDVAKLRAGDRG